MKRPHYIALGLVLLLTVVMLNLPRQSNARLKLGISSMFLPLFGLASSAHDFKDKAGNTFTPRGELLRRNQALSQENNELRLQLFRSEAVERENQRLRALLSWQQQQPWKFAAARVILRDPANWWRTAQIDVGTRDGVRPDMPVLTPSGLVGRVAAAGLTRSQIVLLGDPNCKVAARVENDTRSSGIIVPGGPLDREIVELSFLSRTATLKPGQLVRTSGEGGIFPRDLLIGTVLDSYSVESGLATLARVKLAANLGALDEVFVLLLEPSRTEANRK